jgi:hypothetical protein
MVHALQEAHRVLKPEGLLIDLRPAPAHRRLGIGEGRRWQFVGSLHEVLDDDYAANAAIARVIQDGYFRPGKRTQFQLDRVMDTIDDIREWLADFDQRRDLPTHEPLLQRVERRLERRQKPVKIAVRGPMTLGLLTKVDRPSYEYRSGGTMILAILPDTSKTESLLNNLSEADFNLDDVSVVMQDVALRDKIAKDAGPLKGMKPADVSSALKKAGRSKGAAQRASDSIKQGKVLVVMNVDPKYEQAARESFTDMSAEFLED